MSELLCNNYQFEQLRFQREKESLEKHNNWLNESLTSKTNEVLELRKEKVCGYVIYLTCTRPTKSFLYRPRLKSI
jgi:hypothetical protein